MTQVREREEVRDTMSELERQVKPVPTAEEVRSLVEGPPRRRQLRWMRWLGAFAALALAAGITALLVRSESSTTDLVFEGNPTQLPEGVSPAGTSWDGLGVSVVLGSSPVGNPTQLPEGVSPAGTSWEGVDVSMVRGSSLIGNPTQLPEGMLPAGTVWEGLGES